MRQAGRYLPEYQVIRKNYKNFLDMCKEPITCAELALQPIERYELDASILFSDILTVPDAFNLGLYFAEGEGPRFQNPISSKKHVDDLNKFDVNDLSYVFKTVEETKKILPHNLPLILIIYYFLNCSIMHLRVRYFEIKISFSGEKTNERN